MKKTERKSYAGILVGLLIGFLLSVMATMMYIGGKFNTKNFLSAGAVYDFSQKELKCSSRGWIYDEENSVHWLQTNGALKVYSLKGKEHSWKCLYINIDNMSVSQVDARIYCYDKNRQIVSEQLVALGVGENIIFLPEGTPATRIGIRILNIKGEYISVESMQIRTAVSGYTPKRAVKIFGIAYGGFIIVFIGLLVLRAKYSNIKKWEKKVKKLLYQPVEFLQYAYQIFGDSIGKRIGEKLAERQRNSLRVLLFSLLFFLSIAGNVLNWVTSRAYFRYYVLICAVLILMMAFVSWKQPFSMISWKNPLAASWLCLCIGMIISDLFVSKSTSMVGLALVLANGYFIFAWGNEQNRKNMLNNMQDALKIIFWIATVYCMIFRTKKLAIHYNGLFCSANEFSMYGVLMLGVFLTALDKDICKRKQRRYYIFDITGVAVSCYFILRAAYKTGFVTAFIIFMLFVIWEVKKMHQICNRECIICILTSALVAFGAVCIVHVSTKNLPSLLNLEVEYQNELLTTGVNDELKNALDLLEPGLMDGVKQQEDRELLVVWKNYIRKWNLFGNSKNVLSVFKTPTLPENGYLMLAYKYGIFILVSYIIWQIYFVKMGIKAIKQKRENAELWLLMLGISFISFDILGNAETAFGHPLWICMYLGSGYWFTETSVNSVENF